MNGYMSNKIAQKFSTEKHKTELCLGEVSTFFIFFLTTIYKWDDQTAVVNF